MAFERMTSELKYRIGWLILFSIAMGFLETAVVIYLREIYYPSGFSFPLSAMNERIGLVELLREAATVVMLASVGILSGRSANQRFAFFIASFAIWDIFYYIFLKVLLDWPVSLLTLDILFLIPVPWIGPVLAPCIISMTMLVLAAVLIYKDLNPDGNRLSRFDWLLLMVGSFIVIASWTMDFLSYSRSMGSSIKDTMNAVATFIPTHYNWYLFSLGEAILLVAIFLYWNRGANKRIMKVE